MTLPTLIRVFDVGWVLLFLLGTPLTAVFNNRLQQIFFIFSVLCYNHLLNFAERAGRGTCQLMVRH